MVAQQDELVAIAQQEQMSVLQPLICNDPLLKKTMDTNDQFSRMTNGWISPKFKVIFSSAATNNNPELEAVFDAPDGLADRFIGTRQSLPDPKDRMEFVDQIARKFNKSMLTKHSYMENEVRKIASWVSA